MAAKMSSRSLTLKQQCPPHESVGNDSFGDNNFEEDDEKDEWGFTGFHRVCVLPRQGPMDPRWDDVRKYLNTLSETSANESTMPPSQHGQGNSSKPINKSDEVSNTTRVLTNAQRKGYDYTPLHVICYLNPPSDVVLHLIRLCPQSIFLCNANGETALSLACGGFYPAGEEVIRVLCTAYTTYASNPAHKSSEFFNPVNASDSLGQAPLHIYFQSCRKFELNPNPSIVKMLATVESVNARDDKGHSPLHELGSAATEAFSWVSFGIRTFSTTQASTESSFDEDDREPQFYLYRESFDIIIKNKPYQHSKTLFLRDLFNLPPCLRTLSFEKKCTREVINTIMGRGPYTALLMMDCYVQLCIVIFFTLGCSTGFGTETNGNHGFEWTSYGLFAGSAYWVVRKFLSACGSTDRLSYMLHPWYVVNVLHIITLTTSAAYLNKNGLALEDDENGGFWRNWLILTSAMIWFMIMGILCHMSRGFAVFVNAAIKIFKHLFYLLVVFGIIFMAFSTMFYVSSVDSPGYCTVDTSDCASNGDETGTGNGSENCTAPGSYCTLQDSFSKTLSLFFGTLEASDFEVPPPTLGVLFFFNIIVIILLLNIIIAVMSDSYAKVNEQALLVFWDHRFELIQEVDALVNCFDHIRCRKPTAARIVGSNDKKAVKHSWFSTLLKLRKSADVPKKLVDLVVGFVIFLWILLGFLTLGLVWPRNARRKLFLPTTADNRRNETNNDNIEGGNGESEADIVCRLTEENKALKKQIDVLQKNQNLSSHASA